MWRWQIITEKKKRCVALRRAPKPPARCYTVLPHLDGFGVKRRSEVADGTQFVSRKTATGRTTARQGLSHSHYVNTKVPPAKNLHKRISQHTWHKVTPPPKGSAPPPPRNERDPNERDQTGTNMFVSAMEVKFPPRQCKLGSSYDRRWQTEHSPETQRRRGIINRGKISLYCGACTAAKI